MKLDIIIKFTDEKLHYKTIVDEIYLLTREVFYFLFKITGMLINILTMPKNEKSKY